VKSVPRVVVAEKQTQLAEKSRLRSSTDTSHFWQGLCEKKEKRHVLLPDPAIVSGDEKVDRSEAGAASRPDNSRRTRGILATWTISPARGTLPQYLVTTH
jgi:hypothetical protein